jgi:hypothetical protein
MIEIRNLSKRYGNVAALDRSGRGLVNSPAAHA